MLVYTFSVFCNEKLGISDNVVFHAKNIHKIINSQKDKLLFYYQYETGGREHTIQIKIDSKHKSRGQFVMAETPPTIYLKYRDDYPTVLHELKHFDSFIKRGRVYDEDKITRVMHETDWQKINSLFPGKYRNIFFIMYYLQREEFEAHYHSDYQKFREIVEQKGADTKEEVMNLWSQFHNHALGYALISGKLTEGELVSGTEGNIRMKVPKEQKPFKFDNWCEQRIINQIIYVILKAMKEERGVEEKKSLIDVIKDLLPSSVTFYLEKIVPQSWLPAINQYKQQLEKDINLRMQIYFRKYQRIPLLVIEDLNLK